MFLLWRDSYHTDQGLTQSTSGKTQQHGQPLVKEYSEYVLSYFKQTNSCSPAFRHHILSLSPKVSQSLVLSTTLNIKKSLVNPQHVPCHHVILKILPLTCSAYQNCINNVDLSPLSPLNINPWKRTSLRYFSRVTSDFLCHQNLLVSPQYTYHYPLVSPNLKQPRLSLISNL